MFEVRGETELRIVSGPRRTSTVISVRMAVEVHKSWTRITVGMPVSKEQVFQMAKVLGVPEGGVIFNKESRPS